MYGSAKRPLDTTPYPQDPTSRPIHVTEPVGRYVFVVDTDSVIHVAPDSPHMHPKVLGLAREALYAGEIVIDQPGRVEELTNLSGTFQFRSKTSLCCVASGLGSVSVWPRGAEEHRLPRAKLRHYPGLRSLGFFVAEVVWYPPNGATGPCRLQCP